MLLLLLLLLILLIQIIQLLLLLLLIQLQKFVKRGVIKKIDSSFRKLLLVSVVVIIHSKNRDKGRCPLKV